jgi:hypothetical protein
MGDGTDPPAQSSGEATSRLDEGLKSCHKVVQQYRGLLRKKPAKQPGRD